MDDRNTRLNDPVTGNEDRDRRKKGAGWLWLLLPLLLIPLLLWYFMNMNKDDANNQANSNQNNTSQNGTNGGAASSSLPEIESKFNAEIKKEDRSVYFTADSTEFEDEAASMTKLDAIAAFVKENPEAKIQANGSIFDTDEINSSSALAMQRAELVKNLLVEKGVSADAITTSATDNYEGQDDAARAMYARSVSIKAVK